ncbi:NHL repeat-containing protein [Puniceicoccus vermicola]|uniref:Uncharacterized protein n=1 Tax=Puniceicoccus vermicola TaxID=388746 RepID=A0A7X1B1F3_9BACT|nr:hypothetical protein [Puniceicoccus vermicola]MBC2603792.1 hypothetical protein [Puniceicoccus vermicola]
MKNNLKIFSMLSRPIVLASGLVLSLSLPAVTVDVVGVLGNSGEAGETLVRFAAQPTSGMGVVYDEDSGTLWSSGGQFEIKRYTVDGRQVGTYPIDFKGRPSNSDKMTRIEDSLVLNRDNRLYRLPMDADDGAELEELPIRADLIAFGSTEDGWGIASEGSEIFRFRPDGTIESVITLNSSPRSVETGGDGEIYISQNLNYKNIEDPDAEVEMPGDKFQWLNGAWFGHSYHGTIRRFDADLEMAPGVVLGGNSGSFIGYVPGNYEINKGEGMAYLGGHIYAVSGWSGILHLLEWQPDALRFEIIRRIGSVRRCKALALDSAGNVWYHGGVWAWSDGSDAPLEHGIPHAGAPVSVKSGEEEKSFVADVLENDALVAFGPFRGGRGMGFSGSLDGPARRDTTDDPMEDYVSMAILKLNNRNVALLAKADGSARLLSVNTDGRPGEEMGGATFQTAKPIKRLDSVATGPKNSLWVAADGELLLLAYDGKGWRETRRWKGWGDDESRTFGQRFYLDVDENRIWISDTDRNRVGVFDISEGQLVPLAGVGTTDVAGDAFQELDAPEVIAVNGRRAVVYDSGNQRIVKLVLSE